MDPPGSTPRFRAPAFGALSQHMNVHRLGERTRVADLGAGASDDVLWEWGRQLERTDNRLKQTMLFWAQAYYVP